jgi:ferritin-like metal-binding protein YciE
LISSHSRTASDFSDHCDTVSNANSVPHQDYGTRVASPQLLSGQPFLFQQRLPMNIATLEDLLVEELKDLYSAETQLVKALPKMAAAATSKALKRGFLKHLKETERHVERLKKACAELDVTPTGKKCAAMQGLITEGQEVIDEEMEPEVKDAALIAAAQRVEHYEIAGYGCVRTYARLLKRKKIAQLLQQTLDEEGKTDKALTQLALKINVEAEDPAADKPVPKKSASLTKKILHAVGMD